MFEAFINYFTSWTSGIVGNLHLVAAMLALGVGAFVLWAKKGTRTHVTCGYIYLFSMVILNATALAKYDLTGGFNAFHVSAIASLITIAFAIAAALIFRFTRKRKAIAIHGELMIWSYFGLFAALVAEVVTRAVPYMLHGEGGWTRFSLALGLFMTVLGIVTYRYAKNEVKRTIGV